jgi:hypothetical protein
MPIVSDQTASGEVADSCAAHGDDVALTTDRRLELLLVQLKLLTPDCTQNTERRVISLSRNALTQWRIIRLAVCDSVDTYSSTSPTCHSDP